MKNIFTPSFFKAKMKYAWDVVTGALGALVKESINKKIVLKKYLQKSTIRDTRVKYRILGFRLIIGCLKNALKGGIYSLL